jgi:hypothetical protein
MAQRILLLCLIACAQCKKFGIDKIPSDYTFKSPKAEHTTAGIALDEGNKRELALKAFRAAVRFTPTESSYGNLVSRATLRLAGPCGVLNLFLAPQRVIISSCPGCGFDAIHTVPRGQANVREGKQPNYCCLSHDYPRNLGCQALKLNPNSELTRENYDELKKFMAQEGIGETAATETPPEESAGVRLV